jgi:hypothetical protein
MKTNYKQLATRLIKEAARSEAGVTTQWGEVTPLTAWVTEFTDLAVTDQPRLEQALFNALLKLTRHGLRSPLGVQFSGVKLQKSPSNSWLVYLYSQLDVKLVEEASRQGVL